MKAKFKQIMQSTFARNVAIVATGTAGAQVITLAFAPIVTRLYGPEAFGLLGVFIALVALLVPIVSLTYPTAIVLPKQDRDAKGLAWLSFYVGVGMSSVIAVALLVAGDWLLGLVGAAAIAAYAMLVPLAAFFNVVHLIAQQWLIRKKLFQITAKVSVLHSLTVNVARAGIGLLYPIAFVLISINAIGSALHAFMLWAGNKMAGQDVPKSQDDIELDNQTPFAHYKQLAIAHRDFPLYRAPQTLINAASQSIPVLMLGSFVGPAAAGFYTLARTVLSMPSRLIGNSVVTVFYPRFNEAWHEGEDLVRLLLTATGALAAAGFIPFAIVTAFGPWLFGFVFGSEWTIAGEYSRWLSLWLYFAFLNRPSVAAIPTLELQGFFLAYEIVSVVLRVVTLYIGFVLVNNDVVAIALFSLVGAVLNAALIIVTLLKVRRLSGNRSK